ncbi:HlyD family secretion protein [Hydrogenovibrio marinus]|uniref:Multidrug resistance protein MdtA-like barrel-sandwich hybrid domain-containing protein n=1 Tax=Hydrogenovibrio marinus TaxID=28885 RepID=A0A066ZNK8_HYDMR|nr:HlyD family efflux transporter periplasmic adaptor subunit [Hydrogenovibrio marinus]KDN95092.1 hypothetical protein EI16_01925 [Hydrogenovibrio marinus]BBN59564.1 glycoside hydrolase family 43 [Hydrogenovibrio marinus]
MNIRFSGLLKIVAVALVVILSFFAWNYFHNNSKSDGVMGSNGRIEAVEVDVSTKIAGRLEKVLVKEGDFVKAGQIVALMDTKTLEAELLQAKAQFRQAKDSVITAKNQLVLRQSEKATAVAVVSQRKTELNLAKKRTERVISLVKSGHTSEQSADDARAAVDSAEAALNAAHSQVAASEAAISVAVSQIDSAESSVKAAQAVIKRVQIEIDDASLKAPVSGRIQYIVARSGEVLGAGGRVLNLVDLTDVYMTFFLPTLYAGQVSMGTEVRIVLDAAPDYVIPAHISFIANVAQFTPKTVETEREREKLMFRVRARISPALLQKNIQRVKTGLPGEAYIKISPNVPWPDRLQKNLVE